MKEIEPASFEAFYGMSYLFGKLDDTLNPTTEN